MLCRDAEFFKTAFNGSFQEGNDQSMSLPEDDVQIFRIYRAWVYTGQLRYNFDEEECWLHLGKLWIFADKICSPRLKNKTLDAFFELITKNREVPFPKPETVDYVYGKTMPDSALRRIFVRLFLYLYSTSGADKMDLYPQEFLAMALRKAMFRIKTKSSGALPASSTYHEDCSETCCKHRSIAEPMSSSAHNKSLPRGAAEI